MAQGPGLLAKLDFFKCDGVWPSKDECCCFVSLINSFSDWLN